MNRRESEREREREIENERERERTKDRTRTGRRRRSRLKLSTKRKKRSSRAADANRSVFDTRCADEVTEISRVENCRPGSKKSHDVSHTADARVPFTPLAIDEEGLARSAPHHAHTHAHRHNGATILLRAKRDEQYHPRVRFLTAIQHRGRTVYVYFDQRRINFASARTVLLVHTVRAGQS